VNSAAQHPGVSERVEYVQTCLDNFRFTYNALGGGAFHSVLVYYLAQNDWSRYEFKLGFDYK
jgi:hypothetical protein